MTTEDKSQEVTNQADNELNEQSEQVKEPKRTKLPKPFLAIRKLLMFIRIGLMIALVSVAVYVMLYITSGSLTPGYEAMAPSVASQDRLFLRKNPSEKSLYRFDIVFFSPDTEEKIVLFARIVGLGGEKISAYNGILYINNEPLIEPYGHSMDISEPIPEFAIPEGMFFMLVDNRMEYKEIDSRKFGAIPSGNILSKLLVKF